jgi:DNA polymerase-3 subunit delta
MPTPTENPVFVHVVCGTETFLKRQAMEQIIREVLGDADRALALSEYDCAVTTAELAGVLDDLRTLPFLSKCRLVVVREADKFITLYREELEAYVAAPSPTGVLLIECKSMPGTTRLAKQIARVGRVLKFDPMPAYKIPPWLVSHCRNTYGVALEQRAAAKLCDLIGTDLGLLNAELEKCLLYASGRKQITLADVDALVGQHREEQVWNIISAVGQGDEKRALHLWEEVVQTDRAAEARAIAGIAFTVRRLLKAKRAEEGGASASDLMREMWIRDEQQLRRELGAFSTAQVEEILSRLLEADVAAKTGRMSVQASIEKLIVEMSRRRAGRPAGVAGRR